MERAGIEPATSGLQNRRSASHRFAPFPDLALSSQVSLDGAVCLPVFPRLTVPDSFQSDVQNRSPRPRRASSERGQRNLTRPPGGGRNPAWSPDGRRIAFLTGRDGNFEVYVMNADGSGQRNLTRKQGTTWPGSGRPRVGRSRS